MPKTTDDERQQTKAKAEQIWGAMNESEQHGIRFGLFPADKMQAAEAEGFNGHDLSIALMDVAKNNGGMRA